VVFRLRHRPFVFAEAAAAEVAVAVVAAAEVVAVDVAERSARQIWAKGLLYLCSYILIAQTQVVQPHYKGIELPCPQAEWKQLMERVWEGKEGN
jgi:hypothetical protein